MVLLKNLIKKIKRTLILDQRAEPDITRINLQRIILMFYILAPLHIVHLIIFRAALVGSGSTVIETVFLWRTYIIYAHIIMLTLTVITVFVVYQIRKKLPADNRPGRIIAAFFALAYLLFGATVCVIDQMVSENINPFLITSVAVALFIILHPRVAALLYTAAYLFFYFALPLTQHNSEILISVRVNGFSVAAIGLGLALITWRTNSINLIQDRLIENQKQELEKKNSQLKHMARTDMLTGLYNRMRFTEFVEREINRIKRTGEKSYLIMMDLDHFKKVNDCFGHPNGDIILKWIAGVIKGQLRETDILARFGGEEFAVLLPDTSKDGACKVAEKIRQAIERCNFPGQMEDLQVTGSFGLAPLNSSESAVFDEVYREADKALYLAKEKGRNRVECT